MERQSFGFNYQTNYCKKHNLKENTKYTDKFDATTSDNIGVQIKTYKDRGELMMADPYRYLKNKEDFIMVVANRNSNNEIVSERKVLIKNDKLQSFLENQNFNTRVDYCQNLLNSVSNDSSDDAYFKEQMKVEKLARKESIINVQAKRDHKSQKRVQWSIPNRFIDDFLNLFDEVL